MDRTEKTDNPGNGASGRGSDYTITENAGTRKEKAFGMVSDNAHNIYVVSEVGKDNLDIDNHPKTTFSIPTTLADIVFASFGSDGSYRWSKIIGGGNRETINPLFQLLKWIYR